MHAAGESIQLTYPVFFAISDEELDKFIKLATNGLYTKLPSYQGTVTINNIDCAWTIQDGDLPGLGLYLFFRNRLDCAYLKYYMGLGPKPRTVPNRLQVIVSGKAGTGKTTLSLLIEKLLLQNGFSTVTVIDDDYTEDQLEERRSNLYDTLDNIKFDDITITQMQQRQT